ncbi:cache domain-containing sensor histidine kinase [Paenibacillus pasadenensis]|uniref:Autolysin sensor kinase n=1 Tax=Paenibacillus pasadenensis TaxID=217090 RepID=A0A2N5N215_9BACL|nr:histidine kinase [Paenibacillus pasadenensis]PLT44372.1 Autolysin sensor kinase [Paenibacillus pasadenensis]
MIHKTRTKRLGTRFIALFLAATLPLLLLLLAAGHYAQSVVLAQVASSYRNLVDSNLQMIERSLGDITTNMVFIAEHDENFRKFGAAGLSDSDAFFAEMELLQRNTAYRSYYHTVDMFYIYSRASGRLAATNVIPGSDHDQVGSWITGSLNDPERSKALLYKWSTVRIGSQSFLHRAVSDEMGAGTFIGALINVNTLRIPLSGLDLSQGGDLLLASPDGTVLTDRSAELSPAFRLPPERLAQDASFSYADGGRKLFVVTSRSETAGLSMAVVLPSSELLRGLKGFQTLVSLLPLFVLVILLAYLVMLRRIIYRPILQLLGAIRRTKDGDMEMKLPGSPIAEFDIIYRTFNGMVKEIKELKIDVYEERLQAQKAELKHLQLQINPHFFLNTMNIIYQLANTGRDELVKKTVRHMVRYFRFMLGSSRETIPMAEELEHIRNYLEIQKLRYQESFAFRIDIDPELLEARVPSLIVQPFVENAMLHGMSVRKGEPFELAIFVSKEDGGERMAVEVRDNGKGMSPEQRQLLSSDGHGPGADDAHIGIWNVRRRLSIRYGERASLTFRAAEPRGLRACLALPLETEAADGGADMIQKRSVRPHDGAADR